MQCPRNTELVYIVYKREPSYFYGTRPSPHLRLRLCHSAKRTSLNTNCTHNDVESEKTLLRAS